MPIAAGRRRHKATIQYDAGGSRDAHGQYAPDWQTYATVWGELVPLAGDELEQARQRVATVSHRFTMPAVLGVGPTMRLRYNGRTLNVEAVLGDAGRRAETVLLLRELV
jgi:SPP1 family predicted phage head-tail adaptor